MLNKTGGDTAFGSLRSYSTGAKHHRRCINTSLSVTTLLRDRSLDANAAYNTAIGASALGYNTTGQYNTAEGAQALFYNTTGYDNTAIGTLALANNTTGQDNVALGYGAGYNQTDWQPQYLHRLLQARCGWRKQ